MVEEEAGNDTYSTDVYTHTWRMSLKCQAKALNNKKKLTIDHLQDLLKKRTKKTTVLH